MSVMAYDGLVMGLEMTALLFYALTLTISSTQNVICIERD